MSKSLVFVVVGILRLRLAVFHRADDLLIILAGFSVSYSEEDCMSTSLEFARIQASDDEI